MLTDGLGWASFDQGNLRAVMTGDFLETGLEDRIFVYAINHPENFVIKIFDANWDMDVHELGDIELGLPPNHISPWDISDIVSPLIGYENWAIYDWWPRDHIEAVGLSGGQRLLFIYEEPGFPIQQEVGTVERLGPDVVSVLIQWQVALPEWSPVPIITTSRMSKPPARPVSRIWLR